MNKVLTEDKIKKKLNIKDFGEITKDKVITIASMLDMMPPEVAIKVLEQFPEFSAAIKELLNGYKETLDKGLETNKESVQTYYDTCNSMITFLQKQVEDENLSFEDKKIIMDNMLECAKYMKEMDSENKKFIAHMVSIGAAVVAIPLTVLGMFVGGVQIKDE